MIGVMRYLLKWIFSTQHYCYKMKLKCSLHSSEQNVAEILYKSFNYFYYEVPYLYDVKLHECIQNLTIVTVGPVGG